MQVMSASKTSFQLVTIAMGQGCPPVTLLRMSQASGSITLVLRQVQAELCPSVTLGQFRLTANRQRTAAIKSLEGPDCLWVFKYGATKAHSHVVSVISLPTAIGACKAHGVHPLTLSGLESLRHQGQYTILQTPEHILKLNCTPDVNPPSCPTSFAKQLASVSCPRPCLQAEVFIACAKSPLGQVCCAHSANHRAQDLGNHPYSAQQEGPPFARSLLAKSALKHVALPWLLLEVDESPAAMSATLSQPSPCSLLHQLPHCHGALQQHHQAACQHSSQGSCMVGHQAWWA